MASYRYLSSLNAMKQVHEIYIPFQWCPPYCMIIKSMPFYYFHFFQKVLLYLQFFSAMSSLLVLMAGFRPFTLGLLVKCSTTVLPVQTNYNHKTRLILFHYKWLTKLTNFCLPSLNKCHVR